MTFLLAGIKGEELRSNYEESSEIEFLGQDNFPEELFTMPPVGFDNVRSKKSKRHLFANQYSGIGSPF